MPESEAPKVLLKVREAAQVLSLPPNHVYELIAQGKLPSIRFGPRCIRVPRAGLEEWAAKMAEVDVAARKADFAPPAKFGEIRLAPGVIGVALPSKVFTGRKGRGNRGCG